MRLAGFRLALAALLTVLSGDRGACYLGPRLANEFSVLADGRFGA